MAKKGFLPTVTNNQSFTTEGEKHNISGELCKHFTGDIKDISYNKKTNEFADVSEATIKNPDCIIINRGLFIDCKGDVYKYTPLTFRVLVELAHYANLFEQDKGFIQMMKDFCDGKTGIDIIKNKDNRQIIDIDVKAFAKMLLGRSTKRDIETIEAEFEKISEIYQVFSVEYMENKHLVKSKNAAPFIELLKERTEREIYNPKTKTTQKRIIRKIIFGSIFYYKLSTNFFPVNSNMFKEWGKKDNGSDTQLFIYLFFLIGSRYKQLITALKIRKEKYAEMTHGKPLPPKEEKEALTFRKDISEIIESIDRDYDSKQRYINTFYSHLDKAKSFLMDTGVISDLEIKEEKGKSYLYITVINQSPNYIDSGDDFKMIPN